MSRKRSCFSFKEELLIKAKEAALSAVSIYNNPNIYFKSESFIVLFIIAWTYLLHAYYKSKGIDYRYYTKGKLRKKFDKTKRGNYKYWELERCLDCKDCPLNKGIIDNLKFLIGIRHEIEHQMTTNIDNLITAKFQACCINFNNSIIKLFGEKYSISSNLLFSLQFSRFSENQVKQLKDYKDIPSNVIEFISSFENSLTDDELVSPEFSYKVFYIRESVNHKGQADEAIRFIDENSAIGKDISNILVKPGKIPATYKPKQIVKFMQRRGYNFNMYKHTEFVKKFGAKNPKSNYGKEFGDGQWYYFHSWVQKVEDELKMEKTNDK